MDERLEKTLAGSYCVCNNVSYNEISLFVRNMKSMKDLEMLRKYFPVADKCKLCYPDLQKIIDFYRKEP